MTDSLTESGTIVLLATTPAARLGCREGTLTDRLADQLATLPAREVQVLTSAGGLAADLRMVAKLARVASGPVALLPGDLVAHTEALAVLLEHPARDTRALVDGEAAAGPTRPPLRVEGGRITAAGSSFHTVPEANAAFAGGLQAGEADLGVLAEVAEELAELAESGRLGPVTPVETVDLLLVGLVRSGVPVRTAALGPLHCVRPTGQASADAAIERLAEVDEDQVRLDGAVKSDDGFFTSYLVSPLTRHLIRPAHALKLTPNAVTGVSVAVAVLAAVWFSEGGRVALVAGALLFYLSFALDCLDGQLARYTRGYTPLGAWADGMADRFKEYAVYVGLAYGYMATHAYGGGNPDGIWFLAVAAMMLQAVRHSLQFAYAGSVWDAGQTGALPARPSRSLLEPSDAGRRRPRQGLLRIAQRVRHGSAVHWLRRMVVLPIGERTALIAVTAAVSDARVTFVALLGWGAVAAAYQLVGRMMRSAE
ncbi:CDP-alcohol phosphatidyltransferase family protein [Nonomuraea harbinensis]|uniref:CDP-alcohol phosphatidyltransferase family protein n=1 Tax=Nonomuraea harbinensis TaxID=1286938 RepID=A0ABW1BQA9_9ACTN|nr:CDP-alcohol phosphatidyltransferase family protein [Nonomuraea harbinensis]